jgi:hypothetical protein
VDGPATDPPSRIMASSWSATQGYGFARCNASASTISWESADVAAVEPRSKIGGRWNTTHAARDVLAVVSRSAVVDG